MDTRVKLRVQGLTNSQIQSGAYALLLAEENGIHRIPVIVGTAEAQSIAIALERLHPPRPLTHDLFVSFSRAFGVRLREVFIYKFEEGIFYSELLFDDGVNQIRIDSRTSDAIAIALRVQCDIYTTFDIIRECGVVLPEASEEEEVEETEEGELLINMEPEEIRDPNQLKKWLSLQTEKELAERLEEAVKRENYELAKLYRDELNRRKENEQ